MAMRPPRLTTRPTPRPARSPGPSPTGQRPRPPRQRRAGPWALPRRPQALTDEEIEARAAAIVARAHQEEADGATEPLFPAVAPSMSDAELMSQLDFLPPLRQRDREWLLAGLFCCIILILGAVAMVRFFAA
jgi:hypothetical protein